MEIGWLEDFVALVEREHFSRAAEARCVTQSAFSRRIRALEEWVGAPLFDRTTHQVRLTRAGHAFQPVVTETLRQLAQGRTAAREAGNREAGTLTIAATHALSFTFFPEWLGLIGMSAKVGNVQLISDNMQACEQVLRKGRAQFLLCHYHPAAPPQLDDGAFCSLTVGEDAIVLAAAPTLIATEGHALPYLGYSDVSGLGRILAAVYEAHGHAPLRPPVLSSHLAAVLRCMACNGRGMAWLPLSVIHSDLDQGKLQIIETAISPIPIAIRLIRPVERQSQAAESAWSELSARYAPTSARAAG